MRKIRRKQEMQKRIIIISTICLFLCLCVGYAAFQTNISITAKGNVLCAGEDATNKILEDSLVTSGSGIYVDSYENDRYVYRGSDVNNYITFNNETWRIIAIESDGTLKIVRNDELDDTRAFDSSNNRTKEYCSYLSSYGCNAWASTANTISEGVTGVIFKNGSYEGEVEADSELNTYLNGDYYNDSLTTEAKSYIIEYTYNIGGVAYSGAVSSTEYTMADQLEDEKAFQWKGYVALINLSDYIRSNSSTSGNCDRAYGSYSNSGTCRATTWMYTSLSSSSSSSTYWWTITPYGSYGHFVWDVYSGGEVTYDYASISRGVRPVVHLKSGLKLSGSGTESDPYEIIDCN